MLTWTVEQIYGSTPKSSVVTTRRLKWVVVPTDRAQGIAVEDPDSIGNGVSWFEAFTFVAEGQFLVPSDWIFGASLEVLYLCTKQKIERVFISTISNPRPKPVLVSKTMIMSDKNAPFSAHVEAVAELLILPSRFVEDSCASPFSCRNESNAKENAFVNAQVETCPNHPSAQVPSRFVEDGCAFMYAFFLNL